MKGIADQRTFLGKVIVILGLASFLPAAAQAQNMPYDGASLPEPTNNSTWTRPFEPSRPYRLRHRRQENGNLPESGAAGPDNKNEVAPAGQNLNNAERNPDKANFALDRGQEPDGRVPPPAQKSPRQHFFGQALDLSQLGLSDEQKQQIRQMRKELAPKARLFRQTLRAKRADLRAAMFDPKASDEQIKARRKDLRDAEDQLEDLQIADFLRLRSLLTKEQLQNLPNVMPRRKGQAMPKAGNLPDNGTASTKGKGGL